MKRISLFLSNMPERTFSLCHRSSRSLQCVLPRSFCQAQASLSIKHDQFEALLNVSDPAVERNASSRMEENGRLTKNDHLCVKDTWSLALRLSTSSPVADSPRLPSRTIAHSLERQFRLGCKRNMQKNVSNVPRLSGRRLQQADRHERF